MSDGDERIVADGDERTRCNNTASDDTKKPHVGPLFSFARAEIGSRYKRDVHGRDTVEASVSLPRAVRCRAWPIFGRLQPAAPTNSEIQVETRLPRLTRSESSHDHAAEQHYTRSCHRDPRRA